MNIDPKAELLEMSSPYVYALNCPVIYLDKDGELPILINGLVASDSERADKSYWTAEIVATIIGSGIPNPGGQIHYVDGDRFCSGETSHDYATGITYKLINNGGYFGGGNIPDYRYDAGYLAMGDNEFKKILSKLQRNSEGKIIEKIQIYTHSRGTAFGAGYTKSLLEYISANAGEFADAENEVDFIYNMAPHQSGGISSPFGVDAYSQDHTRDKLSGNKVGNLKGAFTSNEKVDGFFGAHSIASFKNDLKAFTSAFLKGGTSQGIISNFIKTMKDKYNVTVTVQ